MSSQATSSKPVVRYASRGSSYFDILLAFFCIVLVVSNIAATKGVAFGSGNLQVGPFHIWPIIADGGAVLFPLAYILGDVISEVYGFAAARRAILVGFFTAVLSFFTFWVVIQLPAASFYENQAAFESVVFSGVQILVASLAGYLVGQFLNSSVLVGLKARTAESRLVVRLAGSTGVGEFADTFIFCAIAATAIGISTWGDYLNYAVVGFVYKCAVELLVMPLTVFVIGVLKRREASYWA